MNKTIGFIGGGNMASAMISGILRSGQVTKEQVVVSCKSAKSKARLENTFAVAVSLDNGEVAKRADILILAVKPAVLPEVIREIADDVRQETVVVSIAAGTSMDKIISLFNKDIKLIRVMPNTPALVGEAMSGISVGAHVSEEELADVRAIFESFGKAEVVPERLMDTVTGVSGSSPAYVYMMIEAMADAAVCDGMPRQAAYTFAAQSVLGAAKMVLETGKHPGQLKDEVCSPGGTTIEAVATLEEYGFRQAIIAGQRACVEKSKEM